MVFNFLFYNFQYKHKQLFTDYHDIHDNVNSYEFII